MAKLSKEEIRHRCEHPRVNVTLDGCVGVPAAMHTLREALAEDKSPGSYYYAWQSNLAMAFVDEVLSSCRGCMHFRQVSPELREIANNAAKRFLDQLISE